MKRRRIDTRRNRARDLAKQTVRNLLTTTSSLRAAQNPVGKVEYISSSASTHNKQLIFRFETRAMTPGKRKYPETIIFHKINFSEEPSNDFPLEIRLPSGSSIYSEKISASRTPVSVRCSCFTGDTKVWVAGEGPQTLRQLSERTTPYSVLACTDGMEVVLAHAEQCEIKARNADIIELSLADNEYIECTPDHVFLLSTGEYKEACELVPGVDTLAGADLGLSWWELQPLEIEAVSEVKRKDTVYCLTVPEYGNFGLCLDIYGRQIISFVKNCADYYFMWGYPDQKVAAHAGPKIKPYVRLTPPPPEGYPYKNPGAIPGLCKHLIACLDFLKRKGVMR